MIVKNKTIIITDPCYLRHGSVEDIWKNCDYGKSMNKVGFTNYICNSTLYGDWGCTAYQIKENPIHWLNSTESDYNIEIGKFCADSGQVFIGELDEVVKINPNFIHWALRNKKCITTIPNYTGIIELYDNDNGRHVIGIGDTNFVTVQTSL